jgi:membrane glycosyltransferase
MDRPPFESKGSMNALDRIPEALNTRLRPGRILFADLPDDAPLEMPAQCLRSPPKAARSARSSPGGRRLSSLIAATALMTGLALTPVYRVLGADTIGPLDLLILVLVGLLFAWSAFSFLSALAGFVVGFGRTPCDLGLDPNGPLPSLTRRTAVLLPVYNEAPRPVFARLQAICESVDATGAGAPFDFFVLSDTTDPLIQASEYALFRQLKWRLGAPLRIFYRHRPENIARKAGNIADWVRRFGAAYAHMVVLDADSLMEGETLVRLAAAMERQPDIGLIQTAPAIVNRHTLFSRAEQFASRLYGPMLARGVAWWSGSEGNYWGHNAIIRVAAFAAQGGLPQLRGRKPFGGHIMSHDFVEAALLRRAGWRVHMASGLGGSYEESPPTLTALLARDRRWCQGNLQHVPIVWARGLHWISRFHLLRGISAYLVAPLWLSLLVSAVILPLRPQWGERAGAPLHAAVAAQAFDVGAVGLVFGLGLGFLLGPKVLAWLQMLRTPGEGGRFGGAGLAALNVVLESVLSMLVAPVIMLSHTRSLASAVAGRDSGWVAQAREETGLSLRQTVRLYAVDTVLGLILAILALSSSVRPFIWMSPVIAGLALAIPLASAGASSQLGRGARRVGVLLVPEEQRPPQILARANAISAGWPPVVERAEPVRTD